MLGVEQGECIRESGQISILSLNSVYYWGHLTYSAWPLFCSYTLPGDRHARNMALQHPWVYLDFWTPFQLLRWAHRGLGESVVESKAMLAAPELEMLPCLRDGGLTHLLRFSPGALHSVEEQDVRSPMCHRQRNKNEVNSAILKWSTR